MELNKSTTCGKDQRFLTLFVINTVWPNCGFISQSGGPSVLKRCRQSTELQLGVFSWVGGNSHNSWSCITKHTQKLIHFLYCRNDPELFEALLYLRLLQFLARLRQGFINPKKKRKEKTSMWDERNYWATFQNPATTTKTYRWKNITISVHLQKLCSAFCHWTLYIRFKSLCFHSAWGVKDASGWIFKQVLHQWFQWQLSFDWLQQLVSAMLKMLDVCLKLNYVFTPAFLSIRVNHLTAFFLLY